MGRYLNSMNYKISNLFNFKNKIVVITGVSGQLGKIFSEFYLANGAKVYGLDIVKPKNKVLFIKCDITNELEMTNSISTIYKKEKKINIFVNNAGISTFSKYQLRTKNDFMKILETNLLPSFLSIKILSQKAKFLDKLKIVNISSIYGVLSPDFKIYSKGDRFSPEVYGASKAGLIQLSNYYANLLAKKNININSISPGGVKSLKTQNKKFIDNYIKNVPKNRMANPVDFITCIAFLSSDYSEYITGQNIIIDGGLSLK